MDPDADLASVAALMADKHRAQMLLTLLGGTPMSGSALAEAAAISRSLASAHLKKLVAGGLVRAQPSGRQQLYSIASEPVADALEVLILLAPATKVRSLGDASRARNLRWARMCYDHLAGAVGVSVTEALIDRGLVNAVERAGEVGGGFALDPGGAGEFGRFGIEVERVERAPLPSGRHPGHGPDQEHDRAPLDTHPGSQPHRRGDRGGRGGPAGVARGGPGPRPGARPA